MLKAIESVVLILIAAWASVYISILGYTIYESFKKSSKQK